MSKKDEYTQKREALLNASNQRIALRKQEQKAILKKVK